MNVWIKICGLTTADAVERVLAEDVDAAGFVFARSVRELTPRAARRLAAPLDGRIARVAVMRHPDAAAWREVLETFRPDVLQADAADFAGLDVPAAVRRLPVLRNVRALPDPAPDWLLYEGAVSGSGSVADWSAARRIARQARLVLAGGLDPDNVATAIAAVVPWGVDVSSGVESRPGVKDGERIAAFVAAVRSFEENNACS